MRILEFFIASPLAGTVGWALLHSLWEGAAISALLATIVLATRSPRIRYASACAAMIAMVAAFGFTIYCLTPEPAQTFPRFHAFVPFVPRLDVASNPSAGHSWLSMLSLLAPWLAPFWVGGVLILSLERTMSWLAVRRLRNRGVCFASEEWHARLAHLATQLRISRPVNLLESCFAEIPMVLGHLRPVILLPIGLLANLPVEQVETVLLHELAHIRRCDFLVNVLQRIAESILFYHPAVWWISKVMRTERENCCDDVVVSTSRHTNDYALALATLERNRLPGHQAAVAATGGNLVKRIRRLLYPKAPTGVWAPVAAVTIFVVTAAVSFAAWQPKTARLAVTTFRANMQPAAVPEHTKAQMQSLATENGPKTGPYWKWLDEDVVYIITPEERDTFLHLQTNAERETFIKSFWERRNPTPGAVDNTYKDEHYRRIAYANEHLADLSTPGWKTDRGRVYIMWGRPDQRDDHLAGETMSRPMDQGGGSASVHAYEDWYYRDLTGFNGGHSANVVFEFVDPFGTGEFFLTMNPSDKYAAVPEPGAQTSGDPSYPEGQTQAYVAQGTVQFVPNSPYSKWLNEDVVYVIGDEERKAFLALNSDEERQQFIKEFWEQRNPTPGSADNKFKDEHYRRIAYSNEHFGTPSGKPGWQTDRGHIYIVYGEPNARSESSASQNGNESATEQWRYTHIDGVGDNLVFNFVKPEANGDFVLVPSPSAQVAPKAGSSNAREENNENLYRRDESSPPNNGFINGIDAMKIGVTSSRSITAAPRQSDPDILGRQ